MNLRHLLGLDGGDIYNFFSGIGPFSLGLGFVGAWWRRHNCHHEGCWYIQFKPHPNDGEHVLCRKHHKEATNGKPILR